MKEYDHKKIEKKWQTFWAQKKVFEAHNQDDNQTKKKKYYSLIEFPYPSGDGLHVGHPRPYIGMDIISRKRRMEGFNVLYPIGWDAFGLPTENYAIKTGLDPRVVTKKNSDTFRRQIKSLGVSFDWSREINTSDPKYYKWTQWIFLQFLKKGLAYKAKIMINWCPKDKIGLANEEVIAGRCERCGTSVVKREKEQWMLAITKYGERLDKDLDYVDYLPQIKLAQRNWIGRSEGAEIEFKIAVSPTKNFGNFALGDKGQGTHVSKNSSSASLGIIKVFTTRPDTIFGVTFIAVSAELANAWMVRGWNAGNDIKKYIKKTLKDREKNKFDSEKKEQVKTGISAGFDAINPANKEKIPVWIVNYVLSDVGTGAVMSVPAHDERDFEFAKKYKLPTKQVVAPIFDGTRDDDRPKSNMPFVDRPAIVAVVKHWKDDSFLMLDWKKVPWHTLITGGIEEGQTAEEAARREILEETGYSNLKLVEELMPFHSRFYHTPKGRNQFAHFKTFYFELIDGEQEPVTEEEHQKHELRWVPRAKVLEQLTAQGQQMLFQHLLNPTAIIESGLLVNSGKFDGLDSEKAKKEITKFVGGKEKTTFKLRDWIFSRQRYWGEPIPVIICPKCGLVPVPETDLPVELPKVKNYQPTDSGESPLANIAKWVNVKCPKCGGKARRETDTMPNWAGSSWYYLRYTDPKNTKVFADKKNLNYWLPVDWYNGGNEHTTLHLLYSRFWHKFLYDLRLVPTPEPYKKRTSHGVILAEGGEKMSKSKGNVINPDDIVKIYGADTLRIYEMFMGPFNQATMWSEEAIIGPRRFIEKVWRIGMKVASPDAFPQVLGSLGPRPQPDHSQKHSGSASQNFSPERLTKLLNKTIKKVSEDIEGMHFNTAISALMIMATEMEKADNVSKQDYKKFLQILSPFAPHVAEELWNILGETKTISLSLWPKPDENLLNEEEVKIVVQVNGKVRTEMTIEPNSLEETVKQKALQNNDVLRHINGRQVKKLIYVKNRLINIVI